MARSQSAKPLKAWLSARNDSRDKSFVQVGNSLFYNEKFKSLSPATRYFYITAADEACGCINFQMPAAKIKALGFKERTARVYIKELEKAGFIEVVKCGRNTRSPNEYRFKLDWKNPP